MTDERITYASSGVNYDQMDPFKRMAQQKARQTAANLETLGYNEIEDSRGDSAYIWEEPDKFGVFLVEGLGTKNIVADEMRKITGKTYYKEIAQDTAAMILNDLTPSGARPIALSTYIATAESGWFSDNQRASDLTDGYKDACMQVGASWGAGESATLKGIIASGRADLAGACVGEIKPKSRKTSGDKIQIGDAIFIIESSGIHANGLTLARSIADRLPEGYATILEDGRMYGEALLDPTHLYSPLIQDLFEAGIEIHYMVNITGHGWRKLMRANRELSYVVQKLPKPHPVFEFIQKHSGNNDEEMYGNYNMGAGVALFLHDKDVELAQQIAITHYGWQSGKAGCVSEGPRQVIIQPKGITFQSDSLGVR